MLHRVRIYNHFFITLPEHNACKHNNGGCAHVCINHGGHYRCKCPQGYKLNADGHSCDGKNERDTTYVVYIGDISPLICNSNHRRTGQHPFGGGGRPSFARMDSVGGG